MNKLFPQWDLQLKNKHQGEETVNPPAGEKYFLKSTFQHDKWLFWEFDFTHVKPSLLLSEKKEEKRCPLIPNYQKAFLATIVFISGWNQPCLKQKVGEKINSLLQLTPSQLRKFILKILGHVVFQQCQQLNKKISDTIFSFFLYNRITLYQCLKNLLLFHGFHPWINRSSPTLLKWSPMTSQILDHCSLMRPML